MFTQNVQNESGRLIKVRRPEPDIGVGGESTHSSPANQPLNLSTSSSPANQPRNLTREQVQSAIENKKIIKMLMEDTEMQIAIGETPGKKELQFMFPEWFTEHVAEESQDLIIAHIKQCMPFDPKDMKDIKT